MGYWGPQRVQTGYVLQIWVQCLLAAVHINALPNNFSSDCAYLTAGTERGRCSAWETFTEQYADSIRWMLTAALCLPSPLNSGMFWDFSHEASTCRLSSSKPNITHANWGSDSPSSFRVTCALSVEFGISSISSQGMTAVYPWCVGGCQPLSSPGILQTGQTCGCCFARSFSVFGCRLYAEHRQLACSHTRAQRWRYSTPYSTPGTLAGKRWRAVRRRHKKGELRKRTANNRVIS